MAYIVPQGGSGAPKVEDTFATPTPPSATVTPEPLPADAGKKGKKSKGVKRAKKAKTAKAPKK